MAAPDITVLLLQGAVLVVLVAAALTGRPALLVATGALAGALAALAADLLRSGWRGDLSLTLWATVTATLLAYVVIGWAAPALRRLSVLLMPYLLLVGLLALLVRLLAPVQSMPGSVGPVAWFDAHIVFALATYALLSLAAIAGLASLLQDAALKQKQPSGIANRLPSLADSERLEIRLLTAAEIVLGIGIATGMALGWFSAHDAMPFDHKTVLAIAAFVLIGALLWAHARTGFRGKRAARWVLVAWLLLTLAYPGVKFVREILLG
ncbi:MAG: cytochrome c biogenesis protein CcsA [Dongiaceae bacterium]